MPPLYLGFCTQKTLSCFLPVLFLEESQHPVLWKLLPSLVIKGANDLNLQRWSWSHKQESLYCLSQVWVHCKGLIKKEFMDSKLARSRVNNFYMW